MCKHIYGVLFSFDEATPPTLQSTPNFQTGLAEVCRFRFCVNCGKEINHNEHAEGRIYGLDGFNFSFTPFTEKSLASFKIQRFRYCPNTGVSDNAQF